MSEDYTKDMCDILAMSNHLLSAGPFNPKNYARIIFDKGEESMIELQKKGSKVSQLLALQGEVVSELFQECMDNRGLIDPKPLRRKIVGGYTIKEAMSNYRRVIGATLEEAIDNLLKRDKERGEEIDTLVGDISSRYDSEKEKDAEIARLKKHSEHEIKWRDNYFETMAEVFKLLGYDLPEEMPLRKLVEVIKKEVARTDRIENKHKEQKATGLGCQRLVKLIKHKASIGQASSKGARLILKEHRKNEKALRDTLIAKAVK